ncbi:MAG: hypothetical protein HC877_18945 [Thioploca sp.]|nr:hypothetical protein [Thioploca sp.]
MPRISKDEANQFNVVGLSEWLKYVESSKTQNWLVKQFVPSGGIVLMTGHQKRTQKTYTAISLGLGIAHGTHPSLK